MIKSYLFLTLAILFEVAGTMLLPVSQNFTKLAPTVGLIIAYIISFYFLTFALLSIPIGIVYAIWAGLGFFLIAILEKIFFDETLTWQVMIGLLFIVIGVAIVNSFSTHNMPEQ